MGHIMAGKTVLFHLANFSERGEPVVIYHYAKYNETILGNTSVILAPGNADRFSQGLLENQSWEVVFYDSPEKINYFARHADLLYMIAYGDRVTPFDLDHILCPVGIHCVFTAHHPHGDIYATVSEWIANTYALYKVPVVPHIVELPDVNNDLRSQLGIPENAVVFGRYGGYQQFNIMAAKQALAHAVVDRSDLYLLLMNTAPFYDHPRIIHVPKSFDMNYKARFVNTCDAMIHCRSEGETFGLAVGEFSIREKPIITWYWSYDRHHIQVLGDAGIYYRNPRELYQICKTFPKGEKRPDCYSSRYNPKEVMQIFQKVFLGENKKNRRS